MRGSVGPEDTTLNKFPLAEDDNSEECAILCESGARPSVLWFARTLNAVLCHYSSVARFQVTVLGGSISYLVTLVVLDFGRVLVIYLTQGRPDLA